MKRDELIIQLIQIEGRSGDDNYTLGVADFIRNHDRELIGKIRSPLDDFMSSPVSSTDKSNYVYAKRAILDVLQILDEAEKE